MKRHIHPKYFPVKRFYAPPVTFLLILVIACVYLLTACENLNLSPDDGLQEEFSEQKLTGAFAAPGSSDGSIMQRAYRHFLNLAEQIPEFGGFYLEDGATRLVLRVTGVDDIDQAKAGQLVRNYLADAAPAVGEAVEGGVHAMDIIFQDAAYTFVQLLEWRKKITGPVLNADGVSSIGLSQKNNKIRIGIEEQRFEDQIYELIGQYEVPEDAVMIPVTGPYQPHLSGHTLRDMHRPLVGGLLNIGYEDGFPLHGGCTYSFNAYWQKDRHWLTNSHCTKQMWTVNSEDEYYQSNILMVRPAL